MNGFEGMMSGFGAAGMLAPLLLWGGLLALLAWTLAGMFRREREPVRARTVSEEEFLRARFVRGEISARQLNAALNDLRTRRTN